MRSLPAGASVAVIVALGGWLIACGDGGEDVPRLNVPGFDIVEISDLSPGASADVTIGWGVPKDNPDVVALDVTLPPGWDIAPASSLSPGQIIGEGSLDLDVGCDGYLLDEFPFTVKSAGQAGDRARWLAEVEGAPPLEFVVEGSREAGHTVSVILLTEGDTSRGCPALELTLTLFGRSPAGAELLANPEQAGDYTWEAKFFTRRPPSKPAGLVSDLVTIGEEE